MFPIRGHRLKQVLTELGWALTSFLLGIQSCNWEAPVSWGPFAWAWVLSTQKWQAPSFVICVGKSEKGSPQTEKDETAVWREQLPSPVGPERETGSWWLIPVGATVSHKAEMHSLLLNLLKIHQVFIESFFFLRTSNLTSFLSFFKNKP